MRHRDQMDETSETSTGAGLHDTVATLTELMSADRPQAGKHRAPVAIPAQKLPTHDTDATSAGSDLSGPAADAAARRRPGAHRAPVRPARSTIATVTELPTQARQLVTQPRQQPVDQPLFPPPPKPLARPVRQAAAQPTAEPVAIPQTAEWRASHFPRVFTGGLLGTAIAGTTALAIRYAQNRTSDDFVSLVIGLAVVVVLWALLIASTPQVVSIKGSVLTVRNSGGETSFDLADGLQEVDVVGNPRTSHWAVLLHRPNSTSVVLRRHDVVASELDPIVRHYRTVAERRFAERNARFSL
jgi:hypothetical protein